MSVVIDANLIAAAVLPRPYSDQATERITTWKRAGVELLAPVLLEYEVAAILREAVVAGWLTTDLAIEAMRMILALNIQCLPPTASLNNPVDVIGDATHERYEAAIREVLQDDGVDGAIVILTPRP